MESLPGPRTRRRGKLVLAAGSCLLATTARAQAHTTFPGMGEFASGFLHPLTTPLHLLVLAALGLWLGQRRPLRIKAPAAVFGGTAALGLAVTATGHVAGVYPPLLIGVGLGVGAFVAAGVLPPFWTTLTACALAALFLALDSGVDPGTRGVAAMKILASTWVSLGLCLVNAAFYVSLLPATRWAQIGVRILGSWIVAIALLLLAFSLRH